MQVLLLLMDRRDRVVTRNQIFDECWAGALVGDDSINRAVAQIRRAADQVAPGQLNIETIPRTGYRLTGPMKDGRQEMESPRQATLSPAGSRISRRVFVAGGAAAATVAAASLGLWATLRGRSDGQFNSLVEQADRILRYEYSEREISAAPLLEQALTIRPNDRTALGLMAYARALAATSTLPDQHEVAVADRAIKAALAADRNEPHGRLALLLFQRNGFEWVMIEDELKRILTMAPDNTLALNWLAALYQAAGRNKASWDLNEKVIHIDPLSPMALFRKALKHWIFGRTGEAYRLIDRVILLWPRHPFVWNARFLILAFTGRPHAALDMIGDASARPATITAERMEQWRPTLTALEHPSSVTIAAARDANLQAARQSPGQAAYAVMALCAIGEIDAAYHVAEGFLLSQGEIVTRIPTDQANSLVNNPSWRNTQWLSTPPLAKFRADPRFGQLCDGIGLTAYWNARGIQPDYPPLSTV
jgi:tetratricopeptide (TPR) repeat protein